MREVIVRLICIVFVHSNFMIMDFNWKNCIYNEIQLNRVKNKILTKAQIGNIKKIENWKKNIKRKINNELFPWNINLFDLFSKGWLS